CGLNFTQDSKMITTRYTSDPGTGFPCPLSITGIPAGVVLDKAYLYWNVSYLSGSSTTPTVNLTNPLGTTADYNGVLIGSDGPKCWGEFGTRTFRADVTAAVAGDGTYTINTITGNTTWEVDGATLMVIWYDPFATWNGTLVIDDGSDSYTTGVGAFGYTVADFMVCTDDPSAKLFMIVTDMQNNVSATFGASMHATPGTFPKDFYNWCQVTSPMSSGEVAAFYDLTAFGLDCYSVNMCGIYFTSSTCGICPEPFFAINAMAGEISCNGANDATAWVNISSGDPPFTISWSPVVSSNDTIFNLGPGTYYVTVTDSSGNVESDSVVITNPPVLGVAVTASEDTICPGSSTTLTATPSGGTMPYSYQWSTSASDTLASFSPTPSSGYASVIVTDANGCVIGDSINITFISMPVIIASDDTCICAGASATLTATGAPSYTWNSGQTTASITVSPSADFTYVVSYTSGPCTVSDSVFVCVYPVPAASISAIDSVCAGTPVTFTAVVAGGTTPYAYGWSGLTGGTTVSVSAIPLSSGIETVNVSDANGCSTSANAALVVLPVPDVIASNDTCICQGETVTLTASGAPAYTWNTGETTASISTSPVVTFTYIVSYDNGICADDDSVTVCVNPLPVVIASNDTTVEFDHPVTLHAAGTGPFEWNPSNSLSCSTCPDPEAAAHETTTYVVSTTNAFGCYAQDEVTVTVYYVIYIPNIITPNGDGLNEHFHIIGMPPNSAIQIFNRWGNLLYESAVYDNKWNTASDGVYYYVFTTPDGQHYSGFFHVTGN
ncbi:MAG TPA: gliding motility-associated C-terminal domain-containing protein, partial [Flavobacteriales bacterium]|nr:gliding motility-associated C-terminal domain-containing protein [Flavobacteriales bacterium]